MNTESMEKQFCFESDHPPPTRYGSMRRAAEFTDTSGSEARTGVQFRKEVRNVGHKITRKQKSITYPEKVIRITRNF